LVSGLGDSHGVVCLGVVTLTERLVTAWFDGAKFHGFSGITSNWWSRAESWSCCGSGEHRATFKYWMRQESEVRNTM